ncbi:hypothetical protein DAI22_02g131801 [Oryza sativa Japonica Group]|nr:hypothetical protein DAI22_02g131801 [Oryza sativa Japonica Group]
MVIINLFSQAWIIFNLVLPTTIIDLFWTRIPYSCIIGTIERFPQVAKNRTSNKL